MVPRRQPWPPLRQHHCLLRCHLLTGEVEDVAVIKPRDFKFTRSSSVLGNAEIGFFSSPGLLPTSQFLGVTESVHIQSQAAEILQRVFLLESFSELTSKVQEQSIQLAQSRSEHQLEKARATLLEHKLWPVLHATIMGPFLLPALSETIMAHEDTYPHARVSAAKLLGFFLQVFLQPFYKITGPTHDNSLKVSAKTDAETFENLNVPPAVYRAIVQLYEREESTPQDMELLSSLVNFLNNYCFDPEQFAREKEDTEIQQAMKAVGKAATAAGGKDMPQCRRNPWTEVAVVYVPGISSLPHFTVRNNCVGINVSGLRELCGVGRVSSMESYECGGWGMGTII